MKRRRGRNAARRRPRPQEHPGQRGRLLRPGRQVSDGRLRAHERVTAKVAGVRARHRLRAALRREPPPAIVAAMHLAGADEIYASAACRRSPRWRSAPRASQPVDMIVGPGNAYRRRSQAPAVRPGRHRPARRPDRDADHRRRQPMARSAPPTCSARPSTARPRPPCCSPIRRSSRAHDGRDRTPARRSLPTARSPVRPGATTAR
jgi:hypothetical protein